MEKKERKKKKESALPASNNEIEGWRKKKPADPIPHGEGNKKNERIPETNESKKEKKRKQNLQKTNEKKI